MPFPPLHSIVGGFLRKLLLAFGEEWCSLKCLSGMLFAFPVVGVIAAADVGSGGGVFLGGGLVLSLALTSLYVACVMLGA